MNRYPYRPALMLIALALASGRSLTIATNGLWMRALFE
jgi:hypothetical protein